MSVHLEPYSDTFVAGTYGRGVYILRNASAAFTADLLARVLRVDLDLDGGGNHASAVSVALVPDAATRLLPPRLLYAVERVLPSLSQAELRAAVDSARSSSSSTSAPDVELERQVKIACAWVITRALPLNDPARFFPPQDACA